MNSIWKMRPARPLPLEGKVIMGTWSLWVGGSGGLPGQIVGKNGNLSSRFFVNEKYFKNQGDMILDMERFSQEPDPIYQGIMEDIFGDG